MVYLALAAAVVAVSTAAPLIHAAKPAPALTVAALRLALAALLLGLASWPQLASLRKLSRRDALLVLLAGVLLAAHFGTWVSSLYWTSTASSVALVATQPIFAALIALWFLGDSISRRELAGILVAGIGCALLAGLNLGSGSFGDGLAVLGAISAAAYLSVGRGLRGEVPLMPYLFVVNLVAALLLLLVGGLSGARFSGFSPSVYVAIAAAAVVPSLVGHTLLNWSARRVGVHLVSLAILGEPVGATFLSWHFFGEIPAPSVLVGGCVVLVGVWLGFTGPRPPAA